MTGDNHKSGFTANLVPLLAVVAFVTLVATGTVFAHLWVFGSNTDAYPRHLSVLLGLPFDALIVLGTWAVLRYEGVSLSEIGLDRSTFLPGVVAFCVFLVTVTLVSVGYLGVTGATAELGFTYDMPWYWVPVWFLLMLTISNGLSEEFVFRGYAQSKSTALFGSRLDWFAPAVGILAAALLFGVPHIPLGLVLEDAGPRAIPWIFLRNLIPGVAYGVLYYLTRNLWYVGFVHGWANTLLVVMPFDPAAIPSFRTLAIVVGLVVAVGYRSWAQRSGRVEIDAPGSNAAAR